MRRWLVLLTCICSALPALAGVVAPQPGEVYREFTLVMPNISQEWRVTDPNATAPGAQAELPNPVLNLNIPAGQLTGANRAELLIDFWGGHPGTIGQRFRFNSNGWLALPELTTTPPPATGDNRPECFLQQWNPVVSVPVGHLQTGANTLEGTSGGQTCFNFGWGQWGWYAVKLRVYFDPATVANPTGSITSPVGGGTIGENPTIQVSASGGGGIDRVEFLAYVDAYDWDGDGEYVDWGQSYHRGKPDGDLTISRHAGTDTSEPFQITFNTELIPDQAPGSVRVGARIKGNNGLWYVTPTVQNVTLQRSGTVLLAKPENVASRYWVRETRPSLSSTVTLPATLNLADVSSAKLLVRTWNGVDAAGPGDHSTTVNGWTVPVVYGENHHYADDVLDVDPSVLLNGVNTITFNTTSEHHGIEILWPGPALLLRTGGAVSAFCGDGTEDAGEECDDGNNIDGDGCEGDCTLPVAGNALPALYPFSGSGATIEDASPNGNDGVLENGAVRDAAGRFGGALRFDGTAGNVDLGPLNVEGQAGTWAAFLNADDFGITDARVLSKATTVFEQDHYFMISTVEQAGTRHLRFRLKTGGTTTTVVGSGGTLSAGSWIHAAATYDGAEIRLYQDGVLVGSATAGGSISGNPGVDVWIGDHVGGGKSFDGLIDEVLIDDRAYSEQEVAALTTVTIEPPSGCGDGTLDPGEECDDGNTEAGDGCQPDCELPICGDSFTDPGEECDDGNNIDGDGCQSGCLLPICGDGIVDAGEQCDDANADDLDGCRTDCSVPACGDGVLDPGEECDDGNTEDGDACRSDCILPFEAAVLPALYPFSGVDPVVYDDSGNGNDGTLENGGVRDNSGRFGAALRFDGVSGNVDLGTLSVGGSAGTWAAYFNADAFTIADARILTKAASTADQDHYFMLSTLKQGATYHLRFRLKLAGVTRTLIGTATLSTGVWVHAAATYDGTEIRLYQDGALVAFAPAAGAQSGDSAISTWIGDHPVGGKTFDGRIDEVLIDDRAYTEPEIQQLTLSTVAISACGDGILDPGEECDDGNAEGGDGCQPDCRLPFCGDGIVDPGEECDDGNAADGDGCEGDCTPTPYCGDGELNQPDETCDPPNSNPGQPDECRDDCTFCGDDVIDSSEECDDGNTVFGDGCQGNCHYPACGDGWLDPGELCDDGNTIDDDNCNNDCGVNFCGDAEVNAGERCDDGNTLDGDGCDTNCLASVVLMAIQLDFARDDVRLQWAGYAVPYEVFRSADAATLFDPANVLGSTTATVWLDTPPEGVLYFYRVKSMCGNGTVDSGEECDDGNNRDGDGCQADCKVVN